MFLILVQELIVNPFSFSQNKNKNTGKTIKKAVLLSALVCCKH
ncbi:hypothetical protein FORMA_08840 [Formosa sp. Hel3_A1_48]|nr:hypothetical protein FORMA_08840 [Formosa sp. Hel3_A1_48]